MRNRYRWTPAALLILAGSTHAVGADPFPASLNLSSLDGTNGFVLHGVEAFSNSGYSVSSAGNVNGDGYDDLIIGAPWASPSAMNSAGASYVVFGGAGVGAGGSVDLSSLNGANGFVLNGVDVGGTSGRSVSSADVNGDDVDDLIIGAPRVDANGQELAGKAYVVFGGISLGAGGSMDLSALNGANGFVINGIDRLDYAGFSVASAGDVNGDGVDDVIIGAPLFENNTSYVVFGGLGVGAGGSLDLSTLDGTNGFAVHGIDPFDACGSSVSCAGDVNGDGADDLIIGAYSADPNGRPDAGESYVVFGGVGVGVGGSLSLSTLNGVTGFVINGIDPTDFSGRPVASAGDVNADGVDDIIIGADGGDFFDGQCSVVFGRDTAVEGNFPPALELTTLDGTNGFAINGIDSLDAAGHSVSSAGDVNGDGLDDLIIGAHRADPNTNAQAGESYLVFGRDTSVDGNFPAALELSTLDGSNGLVINGIDALNYAGYSVSSAGDINGDGADDVIIGAPGAGPMEYGGPNGEGESYVILGRPIVLPGPFALVSPANGTIDIPTGPLLEWQDASDTNDYLVEVDDQIGFTSPEVSQTVSGALRTSTLQLAGGTLLNDTQYYWRVTAQNGFGGTLSSPDVSGFRTAPPPCPCPGDLDADCDTDVVDFSFFALHFGQSVTPGTNGDLDNSGLVDVFDFAIFAPDFGCGTGP